jgi:hypothetical protein
MNDSFFKKTFTHLTENVVPSVLGLAFLLFAMWMGIKFLISIPNEIVNSDTYLWLFDSEKYEQKQQEKGQRKLEFLELRIRECKILIQAKKDIIPIKIERYLLRGYTEEKATKYAWMDIEKDESLCNEKGTSPYKDRREED